MFLTLLQVQTSSFIQQDLKIQEQPILEALVEKGLPEIVTDVCGYAPLCRGS